MSKAGRSSIAAIWWIKEEESLSAVASMPALVG